MKILVTGSSGFIGSHLVEALQQAGHEVRAMAHYRSSPDLGSLEVACEVVRGEITDRDSVEVAVKGMELVCHLAALVDVPYSFQVPRAYLETNLMGTLNVLEACKKESAKLIFANSSESYGSVGAGKSISEDKQQSAHSPYAASKIGAYQLCQAYCMAYAMPILVLTMFNVYGPRQSDRAVIPTIIKQLLKTSSIKLGDVTPYRDFTYVSDTCSAWIKAVEWMRGWKEFTNINVGSGNASSIKTIAGAVAELMGVSPAIFSDPMLYREGYEVKRLNANSERAKDILRWTAEIPLREGLQKTIEWYSKQS